uniref:Uncharacterized protein n=1 Tax=Arundo donax TaxID=35708 RepID=A0A0A9HAJ1_ARUDO
MAGSGRTRPPSPPNAAWPEGARCSPAAVLASARASGGELWRWRGVVRGGKPAAPEGREPPESPRRSDAGASSFFCLANGQYVYAGVEEKALCFEYLKGGSLDKHLSDESSRLGWHIRYKIIKGICEGLQ